LSEEEKGKEPKVTKGEPIRADPSRLISRRPDTAIIACDFVKYMIDPDCGIGTLTFYRKYATPKKAGSNWSVDTIVEEAFLDVKVPLNTLFALGVGISSSIEEYQRIIKTKENITLFGPQIKRMAKKPDEH
jgi:hypothetical protein